MKKRKLLKIISIPIILFLLGNIFVYLYCFLTPKLDIKKVQSYYLYDSDEQPVFKDEDTWKELEEISPNLINATIATEDKYY